MLRHFTILMICTLALSVRGYNFKLLPVDTAYSATSVNVAIFRTNSLYTKDSTQYISYYDPAGYITIGKRNIGEESWILNHTPYQGRVTDAHNIISFIVDDDDIIHIAFDHHGDSLRYCRSLSPGSLELGQLEPMVGNLEDDVTYPEFYRLADGTILFAYRSGASGRGNLVLNKYDLKNQQWQRIHDSLIDGENERNAYWQLYVGHDGTIHLSWVWRETWMVETNHDLCYARSRDNGITWERSDGTPYTLPIRLTDAEIAWSIPQGSELINQTSMSSDASGHPYIATYWRDLQDSIPQYRLVWNDGSKWNEQKVGHRTTPFSLSGGGTKMIPISRPRMVIDDEQIVHYITRDAETGSVVTMYDIDLATGTQSCYKLTDFSVDAWEPTIDSSLWEKHRELNIYVQRAGQGDGETLSSTTPQEVYVLKILRD